MNRTTPAESPVAEQELPALDPEEARGLCRRLLPFVLKKLEASRKSNRSRPAGDLVALALANLLAERQDYSPSQAVSGFCNAFADFVCSLVASAAACEQVAGEHNEPGEAARWRALRRDLDFGLARGFGAIRALAQVEAASTDSVDLLVDLAAEADGCCDAWKELLHRYQGVSPDKFAITPDGEADPESMLAMFAWETVRRVELLADLAGQFPAHLRPVARQLAAWPVMMSRREAANRHFHDAEHLLELSRDYPLDTSRAARYRPGNEMGRYITRWVERLHQFGLDLSYWRAWERRRGKMDPDVIRRCWQEEGEAVPTRDMERVLKQVPRLRRLTKTTSDDWTGRILVPLILLCDAGKDESSCLVPVLRGIWAQRGVKSVATFKSRLLTKVRQALKSLARPD